MAESRPRVCVIGGAGYVGSSLVKKLVEEGYSVHATLRNLNEESKVGLLRSFAGGDERLKLFEADLFSKSEQIEQAIHGCEFVFLVATPTTQPERLDVNAIVEAVKSIAYTCRRCGSVRRLIYTASTVAASPLKEDGNGFKSSMDETCWTPLPLPVAHHSDSVMDYVESKILAEKEILKIGNDGCEGLEVVSLALGLVGGNTCLWYCPFTVSVFLSQLTGDKSGQNSLKFIEDLLGKIPVVHIEDVCDAHIFAMKAANGSMSGRFLCANSFVSAAEIANYLHHNYPEFHVNLQDQEYLMNGGEPPQVVWNSEKLIHKGFTYKKSMKDVVHDSITCGRRFNLDTSNLYPPKSKYINPYSL